LRISWFRNIGSGLLVAELKSAPHPVPSDDPEKASDLSQYSIIWMAEETRKAGFRISTQRQRASGSTALANRQGSRVGL